MKTVKILFALGAFGSFLNFHQLVNAQTYTWSTIAGSPGVAGTNDGVGNGALFNAPSGIAVDGSGNVYVADYGNNTIRKLAFNPVGSNWSVVTIAGAPSNPFDRDGLGTSALFDGPYGIAPGVSGTLYVVDGATSPLRQMTLSNGVWRTTTLVRNLGIDPLGGASGVVFSGQGDFFASLSGYNDITMVVPQVGNWSQSVIAGTGAGGVGATGSTDGTNTVARFTAPGGIGIDASGNLYVADTGNHTIRKTAFIPFTANWVTTTIAGRAGISSFLDGSNTNSLFNGPDGVAVHQPSGNVFVSDANNNAIRELAPQGTNWVVTTIGGHLNGFLGTNDGVGNSAGFYHPAGLAVDNAGNIYVADDQNDTIRLGVPTMSNPPPALQISAAGGAAYVMWPASVTGYALQTATNPTTGPWQTISSGIGTNFVFSGPATNPQTFYRLQQ